MNPRSNANTQARRLSRKAILVVESLEGRRVPSMMMPHAPAISLTQTYPGPGSGTGGGGAGQSQGSIKIGSATKKPMFYELYTGPKRDDLDAVKATAQLINRDTNLVLTGKMVGVIDTAPADASQESFYVFGINRGSATSPGPFPGRPNIRFDAVAAVSVQKGGISGFVEDLTTGARTDLSASVSISGNTVKIVVPTNLLPPKGASLRQYRVNLWPRSALPPAGPETVASFVPEFTTFRVAESRR